MDELFLWVAIDTGLAIIFQVLRIYVKDCGGPSRQREAYRGETPRCF